MKVLELKQGTPEWDAHRATARNASEAAVVLGEHPDVKRNELLAVRATGIAKEVTTFQQRIFDKGHLFEALARPVAETVLGDELFPCVGMDDSGRYSASLDGLTMDDATAWEHKWLSTTLRAAMHGGCTGADLPLYHQIQMEQQCMVSGASRALFTASEWDSNNELIEARHCWYTPNPDLRARIVAGWAQFDVDVEAYRANPPADVLPPAPARSMDALPSLRVTATGMVTESNLAAWAAAARATLAGVNRELRTDEDFAEAEMNVKGCASAEDRCLAAKQAILDQTADVAETLRTLDALQEDFRRARLDLDRLVKARKETVKAEIVAAGRDAVVEHYAGINASLGQHGIAVPGTISTDLAACIKGLRTMSSLRNAVDTAVATMKIAANQRADQVRAAVVAFEAEVGTFGTLFPDRVTLCATKAPEDLRNLMTARIAEHQRQQQAKLDAERERIRKEEQERADREAKARADREVAERRNRIDAVITEYKRSMVGCVVLPADQIAERIATLEGLPPPDDITAEVSAQYQSALDGMRECLKNARAATTNNSKGVEASAAAEHRILETGAAPTPAASVSTLPAPDTGKRVKLGEINAAIAPLQITADGLASIGFHSVGSERSAKLYRASDLPRICRFLSDRLASVAMKQAA